MENEIIKEALSYSLGSDMHEVWRNSRKRDDGTYEPRIKKSKDEAWNQIHGTDEVDIANCTFEELPSNWQYENLEAGKVAISLVYEKILNGEQFTKEDIDKMASYIHDEWLKRNNWVFDPKYGDPKLAVPYSELSQEEKNKDITQFAPACNKVEAYKQGLIDIEELCKKYGIADKSKTL